MDRRGPDSSAVVRVTESPRSVSCNAVSPSTISALIDVVLGREAEPPAWGHWTLGVCAPEKFDALRFDMRRDFFELKR
jgi:hypothetical protein